MESFKKDQVLTHDGSFTIRHPVYDEEFHSKTGARRETLELYMRASGYETCLAARTDALGVLDVGLGLGYNALMTLELWMQGPGHCDVTMMSLEHTVELVDALIDPETAWKEGWSDPWKLWAESLRYTSPHASFAEFHHPITQKIFKWFVSIGDALEADFHSHQFDYIWQDAFSVKKNPELWTPEWFAKIADASTPNVRLATYSVARLVRDNLEAAGWTQKRIPAAGAKKQWLIARR